MKPLKYYIQKLLGRWLYEPIIPTDKTTGFSVVHSERKDTEYGKKTHVFAPYFLHNVQIGAYSYLAKNAQVANTTVGKFCSIGRNFTCGLGIHPTDGISTHPIFYRGVQTEHKPVHIGNDVFIGVNVTVLDGVTIGDGAVIGAGAVVSKDIPPYAIAVGCPIKIKRYRLTEKQIAAMERIQWWHWEDDEKLRDIKTMFNDIEAFIEKYDKQ
jgi:acetyltransferase-like isoleucine patch superfamily enzyme